MLGRLPSTADAPLTWTAPRRIIRPILWVLVALLTFAAASLGWYTAQVVRMERNDPPALSASLAGVQAPLRPEEPIYVDLRGYGAELVGARLYRTDTAAPASMAVREQPVSVRLIAEGVGRWRLADGEGGTLLRPDNDYRLVVQATSPHPAFPAPRSETITRQYQFSTVHSPRALVPAEVLQPNWTEAVAIDWNLPVASVDATVQPAVPMDVRIDEQTPTRTWVKLGGPDGEGLVSGQTYEVTFPQAVAADGIDMQQSASFRVAVPERPSVLDAPGEVVMLRPGDSGLTLRTSLPLAEMQATVEGSLEPTVVHEGDRIAVSVPAYKQGAEATITIQAGRTEQGAPLTRPATVRLQTPAAYAEPALQPAEGATSVSLDARPSVTFASPPADRDAAVAAISLEPAVPGSWNWLNAQQVEFVPEGRLPELTEMRLTVQGGEDGPRTPQGGYIEQDASIAFTTTYFKRIEVSISKQRLYMMENDQVVRTIVVGTGVSGADTPTGNYEVLYKMDKTRMQGVNPSGVRYDLKDVPWVMPFLGDYAIHGVYWRNNFGQPGSNGCIGMTVPEAKILYDWAEAGTPVQIYN